MTLETEDPKELEDEEVRPESEAEETGEQTERNASSSSATAGTDGGNPDGGVGLTGDLSHGPAEKPRQPQLKSYQRSFGSQGQLASRGFSYSWFKQYQWLNILCQKTLLFVLPVVIFFPQCAWIWW